MSVKILVFGFILLISEVTMALNIRVNNVGYYPNQKKIAVIATDSSISIHNFSVKNNKGEIVFTSTLSNPSYYDKTAETCYLADFSKLESIGKFSLHVDTVSSYFNITDTLYDDAFNKTVKSYYFQRASYKLDEKYATTWARETGHPDTLLRFDSVNGKDENEVKSVPGGWYDAGDYGKYIVNSAITVWTLLNLYELFPLSGIDGSLNIPESGNGENDLLSEIRYELNWMLTMQDSDGGVFFKVGPNTWPGEIMPENDLRERFIIGKSTSSTLSFAYTLAAAGRIYKETDSVYAQTCVESAEKAYAWALENSDIPNPTNTMGSGPYTDGKLDDEFFLAAVELAKTTGKENYAKAISSYISYKKIGDGAWWQEVTNLAFYALIQPSQYIDEAITEQASKTIIDQAVDSYKRMMNNPYHIPIDTFHWGSNGAIANNAMLYSYAYLLTQEQVFLDAVIESMDYIFGKNGFSISMVTGVGENSVKNVHHRICTADGIDEPFPGLVTGGANETGNGGDAILIRLQNNKTPGALCFKDVRESWATNEPAINQNAPVIFLLGFLETTLDKNWIKRYE